MKELSVTVPSPDIDITINNNTLANLTERLMTLTLTDNRAFEADRVTLTLDDTDGQLQLPPRGARLRVMIGWRGESLVNKGTYVVDEVAWEGPPDKLIITASSADFREEFNVRREVSWHDVTVKQVVSAIAHRYGLKTQISEILMDIEIDHADQTEESDISFLTRMAEMLGAIATVKTAACYSFCRVAEPGRTEEPCLRSPLPAAAATVTAFALLTVMRIRGSGRTGSI